MRKVISAILVIAFTMTGIGDCPQRGLSPQVYKLAPQSRFANEAARDPSRIKLEDGARVVVIGGGPAGSFFAISLLRKAKELGIKVEVVIIEEKKDLQFYGLPCQSICKEGCNYCAGIISPRMSDVLKKLKIEVPKTLIQGRVNTITVQGDWKNMELRVPKKRRMFSVYRGSRPKARIDKFVNFDSFLLEKAKEEGAKVIAGKVSGVERSSEGRMRLGYKTTEGNKVSDGTLGADFVVFAGGVNHPVAGARFTTNGLQRSLEGLMPGFVPPKARRALIFELESDEESVRRMAGKAYFIEYGSKDLKIEMCSIMPKGERFITVVVIGKSVDDNEPRVKEKFLELPHIKKILPKNAKLKAVCACNPNMTVTAAMNPFSDRVAIIGDAVASRLYKDGIYSAYITAKTLADTMLEVGIDKASLKKGYEPVIRKFSRDNWFGRFVFMLNRLVFSSPSLSRILYQAISTERKTSDKDNRRLEAILWRIASGDDDYKKIFMSMFHPATAWSVLAGGALITLRNYIAERIFGIDWRGIGRYPTGIYKEELEGKRRRFIRDLHEYQIEARPDFESMYSIKVMADKKDILEQLGKFGEKDMEYFSPRMIHVRRVQGRPNQQGSVIRYKFLFGLLSLDIILEGVVQGRYLVYKVKDGFAKGGVLIFNIDKVNEGECILSIYVAFNVPKGRRLPSRIFWRIFSWIFPSFLHDVIWNHALCKLKDIVEAEGEQTEPDTAVQPSGSTINSHLRIVNEWTVDVSQGESKKTNKPGVSLEAGLTICLAVAAYNPKTGERVMAHFLPTEHQKIAEKESVPLEEAKELYIERLLKDIKGGDWQVTIVSAEKPALGKATSEYHILPIELRGYLVNRNSVDREKITMHPDMPEGIIWRRVTINDKGKVDVKEHDVSPGTLWMQKHAVRVSG